jgi:hypothetical protein
MTEKEKSAAQKMRDFFLENKKKSKEKSNELAELLNKKEKNKDRSQDKAARPFNPEAGA